MYIHTFTFTNRNHAHNFRGLINTCDVINVIQKAFYLISFTLKICDRHPFLPVSPHGSKPKLLILISQKNLTWLLVWITGTFFMPVDTRGLDFDVFLYRRSVSIGPLDHHL